jgi:hypothetical protein
MTNTPQQTRTGPPQGPVFSSSREPAPQNLADVLERVLDKGIVVVGDIQVRLLDIELLTIKIRLMVASVDRAKEMGITWWESDPFVSGVEEPDEQTALERRVGELEERLDRGEVRRGR